MNPVAVKLLCLPYAGGSEISYSNWRGRSPTWLDVSPVALPGRGRRIAEPLVVDCHEMVGALRAEHADSLQADYALFGHSMGALLAYEMAVQTQVEGARPPLALFVGGSRAPSRRRPNPAWTGTDEEMLALIRAMGGTPAELLDDPEWRELFLPILRADFQLCATYQARPREPLRCPIYVLAGDRDPATACKESVCAWSIESAVGGEIRYFTGGHFFVHDQQNSVVEFIARSLRRIAKNRDAPRPLARSGDDRETDRWLFPNQRR